MRALHAIVLATLLLAAGPARADLAILGICQSLVGDETSCDVDTDWSVEKLPWDDFILDPDGDTVGYTVTVTEGETSYRLDIVSVVTLTGQLVEGTEVRSVIASLQLEGEDGGWATIASAPYGEVVDNCGCGFVDNGQMTLDVRDSQGNGLPEGQDAIVEFVGFGDNVYLVVRASYDLGQGVILPNSRVRVQNCVNFASIDDNGVGGCAYEGGAVHTTKACTPFDFEDYKTPGDGKVVMVEELGVPDHDFIVLSDFTATSTSEAPVFPSGPVPIIPGGPQVAFQIGATGQPGTDTVIDVEGTAECVDIVTCDDDVDGVCVATLDNMAGLQLSEDLVSSWASVQLGCHEHTCEGEVCDDGDPCTADTCVPGVGCVSSALEDNAPCEDGDPCTMGDSCIQGVCVGGEAMACADDGNPCTETWCDPVAGCVTGWAEQGTACDDGDLCTNGDQCKYGNCWPGEAVECGTANPCAVGACDPVEGCIEVPRDGGECDDGDPCTHDEYCAAGVCTPAAVTDCDDGDPCTFDSCDAFDGCTHEPHDGACEDGDPCTEGETCVAGQCQGGQPVTCPAGAECTVGVCDPAQGCVYETAPDGFGCSDGDACTGCPWPDTGVKRGFRVTAAPVMAGFDLPADYVAWLPGLFGGKAEVRLREYGDLFFLIFEDDTAVLRGRVDVFDDGGGPPATDQIWNLEVHFSYRGQGAAGQGSGGPKRELGMENQGFEWTDLWRYWNMTSGQMVGTETGTVVTFTERPGPGVFPWQVGPRANDRNLGVGGAMWMDFTHQVGAEVFSGPGDINVDLAEVFCGAGDVCVGGVCGAGESTLMCSEVDAGDYCSFTHREWASPCGGGGCGHGGSCGDEPDASGARCLLDQHLAAITTPALLCQGEPTLVAGFSTHRRYAFSDADRLATFLDPHYTGWWSGAGSLCNPSWKFANPYRKMLFALKLNVAFSDAGKLPAPHGVPFGDLRVAGGDCEGYTVREVLHRAEMVFDGLTPQGARCSSESAITRQLDRINRSFLGCVRKTGLVDSPF